MVDFSSSYTSFPVPTSWVSGGNRPSSPAKARWFRPNSWTHQGPTNGPPKHQSHETRFGQQMRKPTGWWFGCHEFYFPRNIGLLSSSQLTNSYFSEGWPNHQPENHTDPLNQWCHVLVMFNGKNPLVVCRQESPLQPELWAQDWEEAMDNWELSRWFRGVEPWDFSWLRFESEKGEPNNEVMALEEKIRKKWTRDCCLVVCLPSILFSQKYWVAFIIPIDELIFFRGVAQPPTSDCFRGFIVPKWFFDTWRAIRKLDMFLPLCRMMNPPEKQRRNMKQLELCHSYRILYIYNYIECIYIYICW